jgi:RHS repeat-associated protein
MSADVFKAVLRCAAAACLFVMALLGAASPALAQVDLRVSAVSVGAVVSNANGSFSVPVTYTVTNAGSASTTGAWWDVAYLSADGVLDNTDQSQAYLNQQTVMLAPGASYTLTKTFTTTTNTAAGTYTFIVKADGHNSTYTGGTNTDGGNLVEGNEANNTASRPVALIPLAGTTTTALTASPNPVQAGQNVTLTATVWPATATGTMAFKDGSTVLASVPVSGGLASFSARFMSAGVHSLTAEYSGDTANAASTSAALSETVSTFVSSIALTVTPNPAFTNRALTMTATVNSLQGGGTVTFKSGSTVLGTLLLNGASSLTFNPTIGSAGAHSISAVYSGDANNSPATSNAVALQVSGPAVPSGALVRQFGYDPKGNRRYEIDPNGNRTDHLFDALDRPQQDTGPAPVPGGSRPLVGYSRNPADALTRVTDPRGLATTYTVDGLGNRKATTSPDAGQGGATYDAAGRVTTRTDARGKLTRYSYDSIDRLTRIDYASGTPTVFEYDGGANPQPTSTGRLTRITDESGSTSFTHDAFGNVLSKTQVAGSGAAAKTFSVAYAWGTSDGATGKLVSMTYPSGTRVNYGYSPTGRLASITLNPMNANGVGTNTALTVPVLSGIGYTGANDLRSWTWGDGTAYTRSFDSFGRLIRLPLGKPGGSGISAGLLRSMEYDNGRNPKAYRHTQAGTAQPLLDQTFIYDALDRLTDATVAGAHYGYAYDLNGNRNTRVIGSTSYASTMAANSNRLLQAQAPSAGGTVTSAQTYDAAGNLINNGSATFSYSDRGRMSSATVSGGTVAYRYNGLEQRVSKAGPKALVPTAAAYYVYDEEGQLLGEYDADLVPVHETVYLGDLPVAVLKQTGSGKTANLQVLVYDVHADHLNTPRVITRAADQAIMWRWDGAEPFGASAPNENPKGLGVFRFGQRFPGQYFDQESGLHYNGWRSYDPSTGGRYAQSDPIGLAGGINPYAYVSNNPLSFVDPNGLQALPIGSAGGAVGGAGGLGGLGGMGGTGGRGGSLPGSGRGSSEYDRGGDRGSCTLYHIVDCAGETVYVGITQQDPRARESQHMTRFNEGKIRLYECVNCNLTFTPIRTYQTRSECKSAESQQIRALRPFANDEENPDSATVRYEKYREWFSKRCIPCQ